MGTRSTTVFIDDGVTLCRVYRQFDGYPSGHGADLAKLCSVRLTNGIGADSIGTANGMGCLAALVIMGLKEGCKSKFAPTGVGGVYIVPVDAEDEEFHYEVTGNVGQTPTITVFSDCTKLWSGPADKFDEAISLIENDDE